MTLDWPGRLYYANTSFTAVSWFHKLSFRIATMKSQRLLFLGLVGGILFHLPVLAQAMTAEEATKASRESGQPLLIVACRHTCDYTSEVVNLSFAKKYFRP